MSDKVTTIEELKSIKKALEHYPAGAFIEDIEQQIELKIPRRTLQRRLLALQNAEHLYIEGKTSATKYFLKGEREAPVYVATIANEGIPLSKEGKEILQMVKQSLQQREPVGYNRDFLDRY